MKTILYGISALTCGVIIAGTVKFNSLDVPYESSQVIYQTDAGDHVAVRYRVDGDAIELNTPDYSRKVLKRVQSASGEAFANHDGSLVFRAKGSALFIEQDDRIVLRGTRLQDDTIPPASLIKSNIANTDLSARIRLLDCEVTFQDATYTTQRCAAEVVTLYASKVGDPGKMLIVQRTYETGLQQEPSENAEWLISANRTNDGAGPVFVEPDVAYFFRHLDALEKHFEG